MNATPLIATGAVAAMAALGLLRLGWGRPARSWAMNAAAWALLVAGLVAGGAGAGAWGVSIVAVAGTMAAFALLTIAGLAPRREAARASQRRAHALPDAGEPLGLWRRLLTFALTVPLAFAAALLVAMGARALAGLAGWHEANGNVLALFTLPIAWTILMTLLLIVPRARTRWLMLALPSLVSGFLLLAGGRA